jgi:DNA-binding FadR family transcriptional regulator
VADDPNPPRNRTRSLLDNLGRAIVVGDFDEAAFPTEAELAIRYGVSRSVTREAVKMLTAKGLLSARPRWGTLVEPQSQWNLLDPDVLRWLLDRPYSQDLLRQFNELRLAVEPAAAALAARVADASALARISAGYERMVEADGGRDDPLAADIAFHVAILQATGNPFYMHFQDMVAAALETSIRFTNQIAGHSASLTAHAAVLEAIRAGDAARSSAAMTEIVVDVLTLIDGQASTTLQV